MKRMIPITLTFVLIFFASSAFAERSHGYYGSDYRSNHEYSQHHYNDRDQLTAQELERKARRAAKNGNYQKAYKLQKKSDKISQREERQLKKRYARHNQDSCNDRSHRHYKKSHVRVVAPNRDYRHHDNLFSMMIQRPGIVLGWEIHR